LDSSSMQSEEPLHIPLEVYPVHADNQEEPTTSHNPKRAVMPREKMLRSEDLGCTYELHHD
jgi:hypothetical protein